ncbi:unnamed protein product [Triticum turgidum subsp. durum]|uniref:non-specific serine/threonine protein kinase n=1 Tax=Triticum turgidum subsp. durum TaxID=4567 RepID=A0A9R0X1I0_TRITD|nr:unnamed protein product [Triticum turgidum subsp. durum]
MESSGEELLKKIRQLEVGQAQLKQEMSKNRSAENLYGYPASEVLGQDALMLLVDSRDLSVVNDMFRRISLGESWTGKFPVKNKAGDRFLAVGTNTPFYDEDGSLVGIICVSSDSRALEEILSGPSTSARITQANKVTNKVRSRVKMDENGMLREGGSGESQCSDRDNKEGPSSGPSTPRGDAPHGAFGTEENSPGKSTKTNGDESEAKIGLHKILSSKAEALLNKKGITWPWKGRENDGPDCRNQVTWPSLHGEQENGQNHPKISDTQVAEFNQPNKNEASGSWSSFNNNSSSSASSTGSTNSSALYKIDHEADCLDYEILWEDLVIGEQVGQEEYKHEKNVKGTMKCTAFYYIKCLLIASLSILICTGSCGTVYHALWYGSDVGVKVFSRQEYSEEVIQAFRQEVSLMKKLRHPNILLFMGAVTSPHRLCIVTEFLPRGSLFRLLQRSTTKLDWRRRVHMALDVITFY